MLVKSRTPVIGVVFLSYVLPSSSSSSFQVGVCPKQQTAKSNSQQPQPTATATSYSQHPQPTAQYSMVPVRSCKGVPLIRDGCGALVVAAQYSMVPVSSRKGALLFLMAVVCYYKCTMQAWR